MTDSVLDCYEKNDSYQNIADDCLLYANFLKQPLTLGMFIPCDEYGNVFEVPTKENSNNTIDHDTKLMDYNDAKSEVFF